MAEAANKILKLPPVPAREYGCESADLSSENIIMLHGMKLVTNPCSEVQGSKFSGRSHKTFMNEKQTIFGL